jgi:hypothetical protein
MPDYSAFCGFSEEEKIKNMQTLDSKKKFLLVQEGIRLFHGVGIYDKHVHLDVREEKALWTGKSR